LFLERKENLFSQVKDGIILSKKISFPVAWEGQAVSFPSALLCFSASNTRGPMLTAHIM
jgi:hypothetical protein